MVRKRTWPLVLACALISIAAEAPEQPLPFSHKAHAGAMKLPCKTCHLNADPGETMGIPQAVACMQCHSTIKTDSPAIRKLAAYAENKRPIPWVRVYQIPDYVFFSHRRHLTAGATCEDCHGKVVESEQLARVTNISMGGCMDCHRARNAGIQCTYCHEER